MVEQTLRPGWATYLRVSDEDKQTPERSFAMQRHRIKEDLLSKSDKKLHREYFDVLTGTSPNRADYQEMLADAHRGKFSHLGLYRADRFGRNAVEGLQAATKLISLGIKLRVANMPSLQPETPDGFFMFLLQMGMAQREVDVLGERTRDGMEAKLRAGGWPQRAPDGYVNKERQVSSNKYDRWVEIDPDYAPILKDAWKLLLTGRYTLTQICDELSKRGYTRASGRPWIWQDKKSRQKKYAISRLQKIFHNPFYAGWVVSERFGIKVGEVRGKWDPIVSTAEFQKGVEILRKHDNNKSRIRRHHYLLRGLLWVEVVGKRYKLYGSTPSGRSKRYAYYISHAKPNGKKLRIPAKDVENRVPEWLQGISIDKEMIPNIRKIYESEVKQHTNQNRGNQINELRRKLSELKEEETRLGRLLITERISEESFDQLRSEWKEKLRHTELRLAALEKDARTHVDDLDMAIALLAQIERRFSRLEFKQRSTLLQILAKRITVSDDGKIIDYELNSPFVYLRSLADNYKSKNILVGGSGTVREGAPSKPHPEPPLVVRDFFSLLNWGSRNLHVIYVGFDRSRKCSTRKCASSA